MRNSIIIPFLFSCILINHIYAEDVDFMTNVEHRQTTSLNGTWRIIVDPYETGYYGYHSKESKYGYFRNAKPRNKSDLIEYDFDTSWTLKVPGDWNTQRDELLFYEGTIWYKRSFDYDLKQGRRLFVYFGAANYHAIVYLNSQKLGAHTGGFTPFEFEITDIVRPRDNHLIVKVDNTRRREGIPAANTDWWNFGGLTRPVLLVETPKTYIRDYVLQLKKGSTSRIFGRVLLDGPAAQQEITVEIPDAGVCETVTTNQQGLAEISFDTTDLALWSPQNPHLYKVIISGQTDKVEDKIGFRSIATRGKDILLNGKPVFLRGVCIHEESPFGSGRASSPEDAKILLGWAKELGCNFVRLAHYPHNEAMIRTADKMGLLVWSEIPVYWAILWENKDTYENAERQLTEMITRYKNCASVILWSMANETPPSEPRSQFLSRLIDKARQLDSTRLITAAIQSHSKGNTVIIDDPLGEYLDVLGCNEYYGWYSGFAEACSKKIWQCKYNKPLIMSEFGAGALYGLHADKDTRWSEEFQENVYRCQIPMLQKIDNLCGVTPWILKDFRSPRRPLPVIQDFWNRKGLISDKGQRKKAFYVLQSFYQSLAGQENMKQ